MKRDQALAALRDLSAPLKQRGATAMFLFGSVSKGEATEQSDIDLFIDYDFRSGFSLFDLAAMQDFLEGKLGARVDLTTRDSLHPLLRKEIEATASPVF